MLKDQSGLLTGEIKQNRKKPKKSCKALTHHGYKILIEIITDEALIKFLFLITAATGK